MSETATADDDEMRMDGAIASISKLPIFLDLADRPATLVGDTPGLAWKAELIAAAGAHVRVFSASPSEELRALARRLAGDPRFTLIEREWAPQDLDGAAIAVADLPTLGQASAFKAAGDARGVLVNTVDKGATCDFYFGAVVSRSPIMIGATTDGSAPILGQSVRRAIELAVPTWLGAWGDIARELRPEVKRRLAPGLARRAFWEAFAERAFRAPPRPDEAQELLMQAQALRRGAMNEQGRFLDMLAPCRVDCLTLGEAKSLQAAELIVEDRGVPADLRAFFRREATRLTVGRDGVAGEIAAAAVTQRIEEERASGRNVVRLRVGGQEAACRCVMAGGPSCGAEPVR